MNEIIYKLTWVGLENEGPRSFTYYQPPGADDERFVLHYPLGQWVQKPPLPLGPLFAFRTLEGAQQYVRDMFADEERIARLKDYYRIYKGVGRGVRTYTIADLSWITHAVNLDSTVVFCDGIMLQEEAEWPR